MPIFQKVSPKRKTCGYEGSAHGQKIYIFCKPRILFCFLEKIIKIVKSPHFSSVSSSVYVDDPSCRILPLMPPKFSPKNKNSFAFGLQCCVIIEISFCFLHPFSTRCLRVIGLLVTKADPEKDDFSLLSPKFCMSEICSEAESKDAAESQTYY